MKGSGLMRSLSVPCRNSSSSAQVGTEPVWCKVWKDGQLIALSLNSQVHGVGKMLTWDFEPFDVEAGAEYKFLFNKEGTKDSLSFSTDFSGCFHVVRKSSADGVGMLGSSGNYGMNAATEWQPVYKMTLLTPRNTPAAPSTRSECRYALFWDLDLSGNATKLSDLLTEDELSALRSMPMHLSGSYSLPLGEYALLVCRGNDYWEGNDLLLATGACLHKFSYVRYFNFPFGQ